MASLKSVTIRNFYWEQLEFNQNYISIFYIPNAHAYRGISLYAKVPGGSCERNGKHYLQVISQCEALSFLVLE